ncbi:MAG: hypothetical protein GY898_12420 [Proteobacteria bacterium]|nr:hypothetical protein [Pseudomonadota bacterium]
MPANPMGRGVPNAWAAVAGTQKETAPDAAAGQDFVAALSQVPGRERQAEGDVVTAASGEVETPGLDAEGPLSANGVAEMGHLDAEVPVSANGVAEMGHLDAEVPLQVNALAEMGHLDAGVPLPVQPVVEMPHLDVDVPVQGAEDAVELAPEETLAVAAVAAVVEFIQVVAPGRSAQPMVQMTHLDAAVPTLGHAVAQMGHLGAELPVSASRVAETGHLGAELPLSVRGVAEMGHLDAPTTLPAPAPTPAASAPTPTAGAPAPTVDLPPGLDLAGGDAGLANDVEPLKGSVRLASVRGARVVVPMEDGSAVRARVDVVDDAVDVALRASPETGLAADQRVGELREALARQGLELRNFDVSADSGQDRAGADGHADPNDAGPHRDAVPGPYAGADPMAVGPSIEPTPTPYSAADDLGRGGLLSRRF